MKPLVSISVVTYNHANYIKECLDGILMQQTTFPFEIILGEDQSNDGTREICVEYANKYTDIIKLFLRDRKDVIYINKSSTGRYNFIQNLKTAKGKYIALCEGDDYWTDPLKLQKQVDFLEANKDYNICFHRTEILKEGKLKVQPIPNSFEANPFEFIELIRHYNFIATASVMFRKPKKIHFPLWFYKVPFGDLGLYKIISNGKIVCINEVLSVYRIHDKGIYSKLKPIEQNENKLKFYNLIYSSLNSNEKRVVNLETKVVLNNISNLKFKNEGLRKLYDIYSHLIIQIVRR